MTRAGSLGKLLLTVVDERDQVGDGSVRARRVRDASRDSAVHWALSLKVKRRDEDEGARDQGDASRLVFLPVLIAFDLVDGYTRYNTVVTCSLVRIPCNYFPLWCARTYITPLQIKYSSHRLKSQESHVRERTYPARISQ